MGKGGLSDNTHGWLWFAVVGFLLVFPLYYYILDWVHRLALKRQDEEQQRATERQAQRRRPGAIARSHEIFQNVLEAVRQYTHPAKPKYYLLRRTRSLPPNEMNEMIG